MRSFGNELNRLALAVSSIDEAKWFEIREILKEYFKETLGAHYFNLMVDGIRVGGEPGLRTVWSSDSSDHSDPLFKDGKYFGLRSLSYHKGQYLWIVAKEKDVLGYRNARLKDLWSGDSGDDSKLPPYNKTHDLPSSTAVITPLSFGGKYFGVFVIEHPKYMLISPEAKQEIETISRALARIVRVWQTTSEQLQTVRDALGEFRGALNDMRPVLERPKVFFAYPNETEKDVVRCVKKVLEKLSNRIDKTSWDEIPEPGNINEHIVNQIAASHLGVCYVSEKAAQRGGRANKKYVDNENVLFEAGMFHALQANKESPSRGWIPIREHERLAGSPCFDIAAERSIIVPRDDEGKLDSKNFQEKLNTMILAAIDD